MEYPLGAVFSMSFLVALTGALSPGPLLTYTIIRAAGARRRGYLMGVWIIAGHAAVEIVILAILLSGFSALLKSRLAMLAAGLAGGTALIWFGVSVVAGVRSGKMVVPLTDSPAGTDTAERTEAPGRLMGHPVTGGALVSMANPYWWVWWATIGLAFLLEFEITAGSIPRLLAFFLGHEFGDLAWYLLVSTLAYYGIRRMNRSVYLGILLVCGLFMVLFGFYLAISPFYNLRT